MMRVLVTALPMLSHVRAAVPFVRSLAAAGHEVRFATSARAAVFAEAAGFSVVPVGAPWLMGRQDVPGGPDLPDLGNAILRDLFIGFSARRMIPDLLALCRNWCPDIIMRTTMEHAAEVVADVLDIPLVTVQNHAYYPPAWLQEQAGDVMQQLRHQYRLPATDNLFETGYRYGCFSLLPPSFHYYRNLPSTLCVFRPDFDECSPALRRKTDLPRVHVFLGSSGAQCGSFSDYPGLVRTLVTGLADAPYETTVVLAEDEPLDCYSSAGNVVVHAFERKHPGLPPCDLLICHGGMATITEAISHGTPVLVTPRGADQHTVAKSCERAGIGRVLRPSGITPQLARATIDELLVDRSCRTNVRSLQDEMRRALPLVESTRLLERIAWERAPVTRLSLPAAAA